MISLFSKVHTFEKVRWMVQGTVKKKRNLKYFLRYEYHTKNIYNA